MKPPFLIFSDDGPRGYLDSQELCISTETWHIEESPQWCMGYDANGTPFKLVSSNGITAVSVDADHSIETNEIHREQMIEFLTREKPSFNCGIQESEALGNRMLFQRVVEAVSQILMEEDIAEKARLERRQNHPLTRGIRWLANFFSK